MKKQIELGYRAEKQTHTMSALLQDLTYNLTPSNRQVKYQAKSLSRMFHSLLTLAVVDIHSPSREKPEEQTSKSVYTRKFAKLLALRQRSELTTKR